MNTAQFFNTWKMNKRRCASICNSASMSKAFCGPALGIAKQRIPPTSRSCAKHSKQALRTKIMFVEHLVTDLK